jgi:hypothetical protein
VRVVLSSLSLILILVGCGAEPAYQDVSEVTLPLEALGGFSMDAEAADFDGDGDLDLLIAQEYRPNNLLMNQGEARFTNESGSGFA